MTDLAPLLLKAAFACYLLSFNLYLMHVAFKRPVFWRTAFGLVLTGFGLHTICLGLHWYLAGYLPVTNLFSTLFFFSWALAATYLYFELRYRIHASGLFIMLLNLLLLGTALTRDAALRPLIPALDTPLFTLQDRKSVV